MKHFSYVPSLSCICFTSSESHPAFVFIFLFAWAGYHLVLNKYYSQFNQFNHTLRFLTHAIGDIIPLDLQCCLQPPTHVNCSLVLLIDNDQ